MCDAAIGHEALWERFAVVFVPLIAGSAVYMAATLMLKVTAARELAGLLAGRFGKSGQGGD